MTPSEPFDELHELLMEAYGLRDAALANSDRVAQLLDRALTAAADDPDWRLRIDVERAHHRRVVHGGSDAEALATIRVYLGSLTQSTEPLLAAMVLWEAARARLLEDDSADRLRLIADRIEADLPAADQWGVPAGDVLGYIRLESAGMYRKLGMYDRRLEALYSIIESPHCADREIGKAYRRAIAAMRAHFDLQGAEALGEQFAAREPTMDDHGRAHYARFMGHYAEAANQWSEAVRHRERGWTLTPSPIAKGNAANTIAYCYVRMGDADGVEYWADRADETWNRLGEARMGRLVTTRYRAQAAALRGDWRLAVEHSADALANAIGKAPLTWAGTMEVLAQAARAGASPTAFAHVRLSTHEGASIPAGDVDAVVSYALGVSGPKKTSAERIAVSVTAMVAEGWLRPPTDLGDRLSAVRETLIARRSWWRAGRCCMALADLDRLAGRALDAARWIREGFEMWGRHQSRSRGEDHPWLVAHERGRFLEGWALASEAGDHELAAAIAEAARGSALAALLSDPALAATRLGAESELLESVEETVAGTVSGSETSAGDGDEEEKPSKRERAGRVAAAQATLESLDESVRSVWRMLGEVGPGESSRPDHGWTLWIDIHGSQLHAATRGPSGEVWSATQRLSGLAASTVRGLGDPVLVGPKVERRVDAAMRAVLTELGRVFEAGPLGDALGAAGSVDPVELRVSPGGAAWSVPWNAVRVYESPLIERAVVTLVPSDAVAAELDRVAASEVVEPVAVFDPSLWGTETEKSALSELWPSVRPLPDGVPALRDAGLLVASVHGEYGAGGLRQRLLIPGRPVEAAELFSWEFPTLTVFGACWVGRVDAASSGDALGFVFPVLARGARTFIGGMFGVHDDESGRILASAYRAIAAGAGAAAALRAAQLDALHRLGPDAALGKWAGLCAIGTH